MKQLGKRAEHKILDVWYIDQLVELKLDIDVAPIDGNYGYYLKGDLIAFRDSIYQVLMVKALTYSGKQSITILCPNGNLPKKGETVIHIGNNLIEETLTQVNS